jgi:hypothetical protein
MDCVRLLTPDEAGPWLDADANYQTLIEHQDIELAAISQRVVELCHDRPGCSPMQSDSGPKQGSDNRAAVEQHVVVVFTRAMTQSRCARSLQGARRFLPKAKYPLTPGYASPNPPRECECRRGISRVWLPGLTFHRRRIRVLELQPILRPAGAVAQAEPLRHDALKAHHASRRSSRTR